MKHSWKITSLLLGMFLLTQGIGIFVVSQYAPHVTAIVTPNGTLVNQTTYNLPYGVNPPPEPQQKNTTSLIISFAIAFTIAILLMFLLMKYSAELLIRLWFFIVVTLALGISINTFIMKI